MWEGMERKMCQCSLRGTKIARGAGEQSLEWAKYGSSSRAVWEAWKRKEREIWWAGLRIAVGVGGCETDWDEGRSLAGGASKDLARAWGRLNTGIRVRSDGCLGSWKTGFAGQTDRERYKDAFWRWGSAGDWVKSLRTRNRVWGRRGPHLEWGLMEKHWCPHQCMSSRKGMQCLRAAGEWGAGRWHWGYWEGKTPGRPRWWQGKQGQAVQGTALHQCQQWHPMPRSPAILLLSADNSDELGSHPYQYQVCSEDNLLPLCWLFHQSEYYKTGQGS